MTDTTDTPRPYLTTLIAEAEAEIQDGVSCKDQRWLPGARAMLQRLKARKRYNLKCRLDIGAVSDQLVRDCDLWFGERRRVREQQQRNLALAFELPSEDSYGYRGAR